jgi:phage protein D
MTEELLVSSAPVFQVAGEVKGELARDLIRLEVEETTAGLKTLSARLVAHGPRAGEANQDLLYLDGTLDFGKALDVSIGPTGGARSIFQGLISGLEISYREGAPPELTVFAEDRLMDLRMTRRSKTYERMTDADIAAAIASDHGLSAQVDADGPTYDVVQQWNTSDLAFLRERARLLQAEIWLLEDALYFQTRDKRAGTEMTLVQGNHIIEIQARADLAHQRTKVKVSGYDAGARDRLEEEAGDEALGAEAAGGLSGVAVLQRAFGERVSFRVREAPLAGAEAAAWARAEMLRRARGFVTVAAVTRGVPDLVVGSRVTLERVGPPFDGPGYYVTRVCHTYDLIDGHRTRFAAERPTIQEGA